MTSSETTFNDEELIARLRKANEYEPLGHDGWEAADRIEALTAKLAENEVRLRKAVDAINVATRHEPKGLYPDHVPNYWLLRATLAEISSHNKGESHE